MGKTNKKLTLDEVVQIADSLGYEVLDDEYINIKTLMNFKCKKCENIRKTSFDNLKRKVKCSNCNKKIPIKSSNKGRFLWTEENIKQWIRDNSNVKIISMEYNGVHSWLILECLDCGKQFKRKFENFKVNPTCQKCRDNPRRFSYEQIKYYIEIESGSECKLLETDESYREKWIAQPKMALCKIKFKCHCGNEFEQSFNGFKSGGKQECNECSLGRMERGRSYEEIKHFIEIESNSGLTLLSTEYKDNHTPLYLRCSCGNEFSRCFCRDKGDTI